MSETNKKRCPTCAQTKAVDDFSKDRSRPDGRESTCRACRSRRRGGVEGTEKADPLAEAERREAERRQKSDLRSEHAALLEKNARLEQQLRMTARMNESPREVPIQRAVQTKGEAVACMIASDWHLEEPVEASKVHGINEYDLAIAERRAAAFFANGLRLTEIMAREVQIETLFLGLLGDFISGHIHDELRETNELAPGEAAHFALNVIGSGIEFLLRESKFKLEIDAIPGNHGRMTLKPRIQNATETSLETFMYH